MKGGWLRLFFLLLCVLAAGSTVAYRLHAASLAQQQAGWRVLQPQATKGLAPDFDLPSVGGDRVQLKELEGKTLLLNFWATWCAPCRQELPHLARLARELEGSGVVLLLVSVDEHLEAVASLAGELEGQGPMGRASAALLRGRPSSVLSLWDPGERLASSYGTSRFPETYLIGPDGALHFRFIGPKAWGRDAVRDWVQEQSRRLK